jgi:hypothetical protein
MRPKMEAHPGVERGCEEILVACSGGSHLCAVLLWETEARGESRFAIVRRRDTGQVFAAKRKFDGWIELSWVDVMGALSRVDRIQDRVIEELSLAVVGE